jgi:hypothetical protein
MFLGPTLVALGYSLFEQWAVNAARNQGSGTSV